MSGLYPSIEDLMVDQEARAQVEQTQATIQRAHEIVALSSSASSASQTPYGYPSQQAIQGAPVEQSLYASLLADEGGLYMGLDVSDEAIMQSMAIVQAPPQTVATQQLLPGSQAIASVTPKNEVGMLRSQIKQGVSEFLLCKNEDNKMGIAVQSIDKGVFVSFVWKDSPAALAGLRFGDQILSIDGIPVAGFSSSKALKVLKDCNPQRIALHVRDRPWCRTITVQKNSFNHCGFTFRDGTIDNIVKDTSAARNGVLINHRIIEVNGQNVVGMKDKDMLAVIQQSPPTVTFTIMPKFIYKRIVDKIGTSTIRKYMDHSVPEI
jgi:syntenin-1